MQICFEGFENDFADRPLARDFQRVQLQMNVQWKFDFDFPWFINVNVSPGPDAQAVLLFLGFAESGISATRGPGQAHSRQEEGASVELGRGGDGQPIP